MLPSDSFAKTALAIAMGDPAGIGPEISIKAAERLSPRLQSGDIAIKLIGTAQSLEEAIRRMETPLKVAHGSGLGGMDAVQFVEVAPQAGPFLIGEVSAEAGEIAYQSAVKAVELVRSGQADAIVTAPLNKEAMYAAGRKFAGYTDLLSHLTGSDQAIMMLVHDRLRVSHVTTHVPLGDVPRLVTPERLERVIRVTDAALSDFGFASPRIGVAALNPHAGEGGNFGSEDDHVTRPVVEKLSREGLSVEGPVPGDTVFVKAVAGRYDAVVAMYHDQGHVPVKLLGFRIDPATGLWADVSGVNVTLGLPIIRTSVDHGTAFDIAGQGVANENSLIEAIELAEKLALAKARRQEEDSSKAQRAR